MLSKMLPPLARKDIWVGDLQQQLSLKFYLEVEQNCCLAKAYSNESQLRWVAIALYPYNREYSFSVKLVFKKCANPGLFLFISIIQIEKSVDGVLGIRTAGW